MESFTKFTDLPAEIQHKIWDHALTPGPRLATVQVHMPLQAPDPMLPNFPHFPNTVVPHTVLNAPELAESDACQSLLQTCFDSRDRALRRIREIQTPWTQRLSLDRFHFDPRVDVIHFVAPADTVRFYPTAPNVYQVVSMDLSTAMGMALGREFPNVMLFIDTLMSFPGPPDFGTDPVDAAVRLLTTHRYHSAASKQLFSQLEAPKVPETLYCVHGDPDIPLKRFPRSEKISWSDTDVHRDQAEWLRVLIKLQLPDFFFIASD